MLRVPQTSEGEASCETSYPALSSWCLEGPLSHRAPSTSSHNLAPVGEAWPPGIGEGPSRLFTVITQESWKLLRQGLTGTGKELLGQASGTPDSHHLSVSL